MFHDLEQACKLGRCDSYISNLKHSVTDPLTSIASKNMYENTSPPFSLMGLVSVHKVL